MSLPRDVYWWKEERANNKLVEFGRYIKYGRVITTGCPNLQNTRRAALTLCSDYERPVKVRIVKEADYPDIRYIDPNAPED